MTLTLELIRSRCGGQNRIISDTGELLREEEDTRTGQEQPREPEGARAHTRTLSCVDRKVTGGRQAAHRKEGPGKTTEKHF